MPNRFSPSTLAEDYAELSALVHLGGLRCANREPHGEECDGHVYLYTSQNGAPLMGWCTEHRVIDPSLILVGDEPLSEYLARCESFTEKPNS